MRLFNLMGSGSTRAALYNVCHEKSGIEGPRRTENGHTSQNIIAPNHPARADDQGRASQISAFARRGIVSTVLPCACADPHGFSVDILSEGGASGSPIFRTDDPRVIGILHAGFDGAPSPDTSFKLGWR